MKSSFLLLVGTAILLSSVTSGVAADAKNTTNPPITLKTGRVLNHPYVMETLPNGLTIGHTDGCIFVNFKDLPEDIQKHFNYNPEEAAKYEADKAVQDEKKKKQKQAADAKKAQEEKAAQGRLKDAEIRSSENDVLVLKSRIKFLKSEIDRLGKRQERDVSTLTDVANTSASSNSSFGGWGYYHSGTGRSLQNSNRLSLNMTREYSNDEYTLKCYRSELASKEQQLERAERRLDNQQTAREKDKGSSSMSKPQDKSKKSSSDWSAGEKGSK